MNLKISRFDWKIGEYILVDTENGMSHYYCTLPDRIRKKVQSSISNYEYEQFLLRIDEGLEQDPEYEDELLQELYKPDLYFPEHWYDGPEDAYYFDCDEFEVC